MKGCRLSGNEKALLKYEEAIQKMDQKLLLLGLSRPALRALADKKISVINHLKKFSAEEVLTWHGIGKNALLKLLPYLKTVR